MASDNVVDVIVTAKSEAHIRPKLTPDTTLRGSTARTVHGVRPQQLTHQAAVWGLAVTGNLAQVINTHVV